MKGVILAGGKGTRLRPLTLLTSKQLLPIYNKPMIYFPLYTLLKAGIKDILIITAPEHSGDFSKLLGSGKRFNARFTYTIQEKPKGLAQALYMAKDFADNGPVCMILGDNIFSSNLSREIKEIKTGAKIFLKSVKDPERFGVVEIDSKKNVLSIQEKPKKPKSKYAQTGLYIYDADVFKYIRKLKPSKRGELEITDLNNLYLKDNKLKASIVQGKWIDAGTFDSLFEAAKLVQENKYLRNLK